VTSAFADDWEWSVTPYGWAINVDLDTGVDQPSGSTVDFSDLVDNLDFAGQLHLEGRKNRFGFLVDFTNLQLSDRTSQGQFELDTDTTVSLLEAAAIFSLADGTPRTEVLLGVRSLKLDLKVKLESSGPLGFTQRVSEDVTLTDIMAGIRYVAPLSDKWTVVVRGDVATGDTDFTWNASAIVGYQIGKSSTLQFGYRYLNIEFDEQGPLDPEMTISGPEVGITFNF